MSAYVPLEDRVPTAAYDAVARHAKGTKDGCMAVSSEWVDGKPTVVVLVATQFHPERLALLYALHEAWFPEEEE